MSPYSGPLRYTASVVAFMFLWTTILGDFSAIAQVSTPGSLLPLDIGGYSEDRISLDIPDSLGQIKELHYPLTSTARPFITHIQDAHSNPSAQRKISEILTFLHDKRSSDETLHIAVEGATGDIRAEFLDFFPNYPEINDAIVEDLLNKGELTGAEYFAWDQYKSQKSKDGKNAGSVSIVGVEKPEIYRENLKRYRDLLFQRKDVDVLLNEYRRDLELAASRVLSPNLRSFLRERTRRKHGKYNEGNHNSYQDTSPQLMAYVNYLAEQVNSELQIDLNDRFEQLRFPNLYRVILLGQVNNIIQMNLALKEKKAIISDLESKVKSTEEKHLLHLFDNFENYTSPRKIVEAVWNISMKYGLNLEKYEEYWKFAGSVILRSELGPAEMYREMDLLESWLIDKVIEREEEKELVQIINDFELTEKLILLKMTRDEYKKFTLFKDRILESLMSQKLNDLLNSESPKSSKVNLMVNRGEKENLLGFIKEANLFYEGALERDKALMGNAISPIGDDGSAVLISGGFHTFGFTELMKNLEIGYAVVQPKILELDKQNLYHKVLREENADLSNYFKANVLNKQQAIFLKSLLEIAIPKLWEIYEIPHAEIADKVAEAINSHSVLSKRLKAAGVKQDGQSTLDLEVTSIAPKFETIESVGFGQSTIVSAFLTDGAYEGLNPRHSGPLNVSYVVSGQVEIEEQVGVRTTSRPGRARALSITAEDVVQEEGTPSQDTSDSSEARDDNKDEVSKLNKRVTRSNIMIGVLTVAIAVSAAFNYFGNERLEQRLNEGLDGLNKAVQTLIDTESDDEKSTNDIPQIPKAIVEGKQNDDNIVDGPRPEPEDPGKLRAEEFQNAHFKTTVSTFKRSTVDPSKQSPAYRLKLNLFRTVLSLASEKGGDPWPTVITSPVNLDEVETDDIVEVLEGMEEELLNAEDADAYKTFNMNNPLLANEVDLFEQLLLPAWERMQVTSDEEQIRSLVAMIREAPVIQQYIASVNPAELSNDLENLLGEIESPDNRSLSNSAWDLLNLRKERASTKRLNTLGTFITVGFAEIENPENIDEIALQLTDYVIANGGIADPNLMRVGDL